MTIYPGDPRDRFRSRRSLLHGLAGLLFLPAQGLFLVQALRTGNAALWVAWVVVLVALIAAAIVWLRADHHRGGAAAPWTPGPLLIIEGVALLLGLPVAFLMH
ncbi:hypothetical protein [Amnibacterium setariae]|uniref:Uncharacterized protein n=1 Tax=Amnibacterium setariae TaxID=2306585 RepID=A0A3A1TYK4_9MICO|nr:hypothetical protein [Amnibacterium setariae]RIX28668.1 hypothetical protein D1781_14795 [Amnibacterium setariae]